MSNVFISYAHVDKFWVDEFVLTLEQKVAQYIGRTDSQRIWKDNRLEGNSPFNTEIMNNLQDASCLVVCLSQGYLASSWCLRELNIFKERHESTYKIFCVELDKLDLDEKPNILTETLNYSFWHEDALSKRTYPLRQDSEDYNRLMIDVAKGIAKQLKLLQPKALSELNTPNTSSSADQPKSVNPRRQRLEKKLHALYESYDLETRIENKLRLEPHIARTEADLKSLID